MLSSLGYVDQHIEGMPYKKTTDCLAQPATAEPAGVGPPVQRRGPANEDHDRHPLGRWQEPNRHRPGPRVQPVDRFPRSAAMATKRTGSAITRVWNWTNSSARRKTTCIAVTAPPRCRRVQNRERLFRVPGPTVQPLALAVRRLPASDRASTAAATSGAKGPCAPSSPTSFTSGRWSTRRSRRAGGASLSGRGLGLPARHVGHHRQQQGRADHEVDPVGIDAQKRDGTDDDRHQGGPEQRA